MISLAEAREHVLGRCEGPEPVEVALSDARGLVLAEPVDSPEHVPLFANTAMDGFAVRAADTVGAPVVLDVVGTVAAGARVAVAVAAVAVVSTSRVRARRSL